MGMSRPTTKYIDGANIWFEIVWSQMTVVSTGYWYSENRVVNIDE
jgi:hypothetical protein